MICPIHGCHLIMHVTLCPKCEAEDGHQADHQAAYEDAYALAKTWTREQLLVQWRNAYDAVQVLTKCLAQERAWRMGEGSA